MKRILSFVLCIVMVASVFTFLDVNTLAAAEGNDVMSVKATTLKDNMITYTVSLKADMKFTGVINHIKYDPNVVVPVKTEFYDEYAGMGIYGDVEGEPGNYSVATVNAGSSYWNSTKDGTALLKITFKLIDDSATNFTVKFYCVEFNSTVAGQKIPHNKENPSLIQSIQSSTLPAVKMVSAKTDNGGIKVTWAKNEGAVKYRVYKRVSSSWKALADIDDPNVTSYIDKTVEHNAVAEYAVRSYDADGVRDIAMGKTVSGRFIMGPKTVVASVVANGIIVKWTGVSGATSYKIYRRVLNADGTKGEWISIKTATSKDRNYTDKKSLKSNTNYQYVIRVVTKNGTSAAYRTASTWYYSTPTVTVASTKGGAKVSWNKVAGATSYRIYRRYKTTDSWKLLATVPSDKLSYLDKTTATVKSMYYTVRAYGDNGSGYYTAKNIYYVKTPVLKSATNSTSSIKVTWEAVKGASGYIVYRKAGSATSWTNVGKYKTNSYTDKNVKSGTTYKYTVKAYYSKYISGHDSTGISVKRLTVPKLSKVVNTTNGVKFTWGKVTGAAEYKVYRKTANSGWTCLDTVSSTSFTDTTAKKGTTYIYTVRAVSGKSVSAYNSKGLSIKRK